MTNFPGTQGYEVEATSLIPRYEAIRFDEIHRLVRHLFPTSPSRILEVGAGTGRDAAAFAALGHEVVAVEPTVALRTAAVERHASPRIAWIDDGLPTLRHVIALGAQFDVVMLTAVWMHLDADERSRSMGVLSQLLAPEGRAIFMLRHGPVPPGRRMFEVTWAETAQLGERNGLVDIFSASQMALGPSNVRDGVTWSRGALQRPV